MGLNTYNNIASASNLDGVYTDNAAPQSALSNNISSTIGLDGTASWGPVNVPTIQNSGSYVSAYGGIVPSKYLANTNDVNDLCFGLYCASLGAAGGAGIQYLCNRVSDGTDLPATNAFNLSSQSTVTLTIDVLTAAANTVTLTITPSASVGASYQVVYNPTVSDTAATIAAALISNINSSSASFNAGVLAYLGSSSDIITLQYPTAWTPIPVSAVVSTPADLTVTISASAVALSGSAMLTALYSGVLGNQIKMVVNPNGSINSVNVSIVGFPGSNRVEVYSNIPIIGFWAALQLVLANGNGNGAGPSLLANIKGTPLASNAPALGVYLLSGGTDGRSSTPGVSLSSPNLIGSEYAFPNTGIYALLNNEEGVELRNFVAIGLTDQTQYLAVDTVAQNNLVPTFFDIPLTATYSYQTALAAWQAGNVQDAFSFAMIDWVMIYDPVNLYNRIFPSAPMVAGLHASSPPNTSFGNRPLPGILGTARNNTANPGTRVHYSRPILALLKASGVIPITKTILAGKVPGIYYAVTTSSNPLEQMSPYPTMINYIAYGANAIANKYIEANNISSPQAGDLLRASFRNEMNSFLDRGKTAGLWAGYNPIVADSTNNTITTVPYGDLIGTFSVLLNTPVTRVFLGIQASGNVVLLNTGG